MFKEIITGLRYRTFCELLWIFIDSNSVITLNVRIPLIRFVFFFFGGGERGRLSCVETPVRAILPFKYKRLKKFRN